MAEETYERIRTINGWEGIGVPPRSAQWQYAQVWTLNWCCVTACGPAFSLPRAQSGVMR